MRDLTAKQEDDLLEEARENQTTTKKHKEPEVSLIKLTTAKEVEFYFSDIQKVYIGKPYLCMCGCSGNYYYSSDKKNERKINEICDKFNNKAVAEIYNIRDYIFTIIVGKVQYTIYLYEKFKTDKIENSIRQIEEKHKIKLGENKMIEEKNLIPVKKFTTGNIYAMVFKDADTDLLKIKLNKRYKNAEGEFVDTTLFRLNEIPKAVVVLNKAFEYAVINENTKAEGEDY